MLTMIRGGVWCLASVACLSVALAQAPNVRPPQFDSVTVSAERQVTFRIFAPQATAVRLLGGDIPGVGRGLEMQKGENGLWEVTVGPIPAGAYRYRFLVDGLAINDPRSGATSESNGNTWSLAVVPGSDTLDLRDVPHGAVAQVHYFSKSLQRQRRAHIYTPPGYEKNAETYPVFYLLHGASDSDASWSTVGRAGLIFDNLIAAGKAKPMVVVMPAGHTGSYGFGGGGNFQAQMEEFATDFERDLRPLVEQRYRVSNEQRYRAIAGLSMGGAQSLDIAFKSLSDYGYIGVFSSGIFGIDRGDGENSPGAAWQKGHAKCLDDAEARKGLKLFWFATGKEDILLKTTQATVELFKQRGFQVVYEESDGGHTWVKWRDYLPVFAEKLFREE